MHFVHHFLVLYSITSSDFIVWLPLLLETSSNMCIVIVCYPVRHVINFETYLSLLIKPFSYMTKKSEQKFRYLKNEKSFSGAKKNIFHHYKWAFTCQKWSQMWECAFKATFVTFLIWIELTVHNTFQLQEQLS